MNIVGIIFFSLGILFVLIPAIISIIKSKADYMVFSIVSIFCFAVFFPTNYPNPTEDDVKDRKAIYIEETNVGLDINGDTLYNYLTYHLEWLPEWKYGRKQN